MTQQPKTFPEDLELYYLPIVHNHALTFESFLLLLYLQHGLTNYNYIYPISKHCFQKRIQKHICTVRNVKNRHYMRMLDTSTSIS